MDLLTWFGVVAVSTMLLAYALEQRGPAFVLLFAAACAASSAYGFLAGAWPFGVVEGVWTAVAVRRRHARTGQAERPHDARPIACDMTALPAAERQRYDTLRARVLAAVEDVRETPVSFTFRVRGAVPLADVAEWLSLEHRCCAFLDISLALRHDQTTWLEFGGDAAIKRFVRDEFRTVVAR